MKRIFLFLLFPFLLSFQCEDDFENSGFETAYFIQNDSGTDLFLLSDQGSFSEIRSQEIISIGSRLNPETDPISPTESLLFEGIKLFKAQDEDFILVYSQEPLDNSLWNFSEPFTNRYEYVLSITDDLLN